MPNNIRHFSIFYTFFHFELFLLTFRNLFDIIFIDIALTIFVILRTILYFIYGTSDGLLHIYLQGGSNYETYCKNKD